MRHVWLNAMNLNQKNDGGPVAQLGEHLVCNQGVRGSSPLRSTNVSRYAPVICNHFCSVGCGFSEVTVMKT